MGLREKVPQNPAGIRTDPPMSVPTPRVLPLRACSTASPPDDPPHERLRLWGLYVVPRMWFTVSPNYTGVSNGEDQQVWGLSPLTKTVCGRLVYGNKRQLPDKVLT